MCYDVEVTRNYFSVVFVDLRSYLKVFSDCIDNEGKANQKQITLATITKSTTA